MRISGSRVSRSNRHRPCTGAGPLDYFLVAFWIEQNSEDCILWRIQRTFFAWDTLILRITSTLSDLACPYWVFFQITVNCSLIGESQLFLCTVTWASLRAKLFQSIAEGRRRQQPALMTPGKWIKIHPALNYCVSKNNYTIIQDYCVPQNELFDINKKELLHDSSLQIYLSRDKVFSILRTFTDSVQWRKISHLQRQSKRKGFSCWYKCAKPQKN